MDGQCFLERTALIRSILDLSVPTMPYLVTRYIACGNIVSGKRDSFSTNRTKLQDRSRPPDFKPLDRSFPAAKENRRGPFLYEMMKITRPVGVIATVSKKCPMGYMQKGNIRVVGSTCEKRKENRLTLVLVQDRYSRHAYRHEYHLKAIWTRSENISGVCR